MITFMMFGDPAQGGHAGLCPLEELLPRALEGLSQGSGGPLRRALEGPLPRALDGPLPRALEGPLPWALEEP